MSAQVLDHVRASVLSGRDSRHPLHATLLSKQWFRRADRRHATWLVFVGDGEEPRFVVRQAIDPSGNESLFREARIMEEAASLASTPLVPRVLDTATAGGLAVVISEYVPGSRSISAEIAGAHRTGELEGDGAAGFFSRHFKLASRVLSSLRGAAGEPLEPGAADSEAGQLLHEALSWFGREHRNQMALTRGALELVFETVSEHAGHGAGLVHFDFTPGNLLLAGDDVMLVDWEAARRSTFWWFDPLKFVYWYVAELATLGLLDGGDDPIEAFLLFLEGKLDRITGPAHAFLEELGFPVRERDTMRAFWLAYSLCELKLFLGVCEAPEAQLAPYGRLIGGILDLGDSPGGVQEQLERLQEEQASLHEERDRLREERDRLREERDRLREEHTRMVAEYGRLDHEYARARNEMDQLRASLKAGTGKTNRLQRALDDERERSSQLEARLNEIHEELKQIWSSKLWKAGSLYWRVLSGLGLTSRKHP